MPEVIEVRSTDDADLDDFAPPRNPPPWRAALGMVVLVALGAVGIRAVFLGPPSPRSAPSATTRSAPAAVIHPAVIVAREALDAWAAFGTSGDVEVLRNRFDPAGPQYRLLESEAAAIRARRPGPPPYSFVMEDPAVLDVRDDERVVRGPVVASRRGEGDQRFAWDVVLRRGPKGDWRVWTVREAARSGSDQ